MGHLQLTVRFFDGRYHGGGWPPSPARLFQALVAGAKSGGAGDNALRWLECLGPPEIFVRAAQPGTQYTIYVPNNSFDKDRKSTRTSKVVAPRILTRHRAGDPDVIYRWSVGDAPGERQRVAALDDVASRLRSLGWGVDFAAAVAELSESDSVPAGLERLAPSPNGELSLRLPNEGFLTHLEECHRAFRARISGQGINPFTRPTRFGQARYSWAGQSSSRAVAAFLLQRLDGKPLAARWDQVQTVSAWLRHAAGEALKTEQSAGLTPERIDSFVYGHTGQEELGQRLSFVPLPSIGHPNADGGVRRVLIVNPPGAEDRTLHLLRLKLRGAVLTGEGSVSRAVLEPALERGPVFLRYLDKARIWQSATPVILHGHNASRGQISLSKTNRLLLQAFAAAGFPEEAIARMTFQTAPFWPGCGAASAIRVPRHLAQWPRLHVEVEFKEMIAGPVLAGIGRHYGLGVFAGAR